MATLLTMPKLGMTMEEGTVHAWFKREGEPVEEGEPLLSVLTDKIDIEVDAPAAGVLRKILVQPGETVPINTPIAIIAAADADISPLLSESGRSGDGVAGRPASEAVTRGLTWSRRRTRPPREPLRPRRRPLRAAGIGFCRCGLRRWPGA